MGKIINRADWISLLLITAITSYGIFVLVTLNTSQVVEQMAFFAAGMVVMFTVLTVDSIFFRVLSPYFYVIAVILLILVYFFPAVRGSHRWIILGFARFQPSELVKPLFMLSTAWLISAFSPRKPVNILLHLFIFAVPFLLVFRQPDLGTSIVYIAIWIAMMIAGGLDVRAVIVGFLAVVLVTPWVWGHLAPYQQNRILSFVNPAFDPKGAGYNAMQATIAVGSGQLFGRGLGFGTQSHLRFLPEHYTDFIFASLVEELGFAGGAVLIGFYFLLLYRLLKLIWTLSHDAFSFTFGIGLFALILTQVFVNIGMNMGMLPITGITLPFVSYGGSSLLSILIAFGLFWSVCRTEKEDRAIEID